MGTLNDTNIALRNVSVTCSGNHNTYNEKPNKGSSHSQKAAAVASLHQFIPRHCQRRCHLLPDENHQFLLAPPHLPPYGKSEWKNASIQLPPGYCSCSLARAQNRTPKSYILTIFSQFDGRSSMFLSLLVKDKEFPFTVAVGNSTCCSFRVIAEQFAIFISLPL